MIWGGRLAPEWVAGINRNGWPASPGIAGRNRPEYANEEESWLGNLGFIRRWVGYFLGLLRGGCFFFVVFLPYDFWASLAVKPIFF